MSGTPDLKPSASADPGDTFYVGWQARAPAPLARQMRVMVVALAFLVVAIMAVLAHGQRRQDGGTFEFGVQQTFEGVLLEQPLPMLRLTGEPVAAGGLHLPRTVLVGAFKFGLPEFARGHNGRLVRFSGSLIYRDNLAMIEMNDAASFVDLGPVSDAGTAALSNEVEDLGSRTLTGELVDTKCFFGVMRPGYGKVHRGCAARCLSGGVPPGLLVRDASGYGYVFMLAGADGAPLAIDSELAARVLTIQGDLELHAGVPILRVRRAMLVDGASPTPVPVPVDGGRAVAGPQTDLPCPATPFSGKPQAEYDRFPLEPLQVGAGCLYYPE